MAMGIEINDEIVKARSIMAAARKMSARGFLVNIVSLKNIVYNIRSALNESEIEEYRNLKPVMENLVREMEDFASDFEPVNRLNDKRELYDHNFVS